MAVHPTGNHGWVKSTGDVQDGYRAWLPFWLRGLIVLAAGWVVLLCGQQLGDMYTKATEYRRAPVCAAGSGYDGDGAACVRHETATVTDHRTRLSCHSDGTNPMEGGGVNCVTFHEVKAEWPDHSAWLSVDAKPYEKIRMGDRAEVRLWRGEPVGLVVGGDTYSYLAVSRFRILLWCALICLFVAVAARTVLSARPWRADDFPRDGRLLALLAALGVGWLGTLALFGQDPVARYLTIAWTGVMALWIACARRTD